MKTLQMFCMAAGLALVAAMPLVSEGAENKGYAPAADGLQVYYEIHGKGEPIVVLAGGFGGVDSMAATVSPLARERQVWGRMSRA